MHKLITVNMIRKHIIFKFALPRLFYFNLHNNTNLSLTFLSVITPQLLLSIPFTLTSKLHSSNFCQYCHSLKPSDCLSCPRVPYCFLSLAWLPTLCSSFTSFLNSSSPLHGTCFSDRNAMLLMESGLTFTFLI